MIQDHRDGIVMVHTSVGDQWLVNLEEGIDQEVAEDLRRRGHEVNWPVTGTLLY